jgi:hypothetical protein
LVPLLLLGLAAELGDLQPLRAVWQQVRELATVTQAGPLGWLVPRAGPELTEDPFSLAVSGLAAGFGLLYLACGVLDLSTRLRARLLVLSLVSVVMAPTLLVVGVGRLSGVSRAQYRWAVQVPADAARLERLSSPYSLPPASTPTAREAWATSFRKGPPRLLSPGRPESPPGAAILGLVASVRDPRLLSVLALGVLVFLAARLGTPEQRLAAAALAGLAPAVAQGVVFGSGEVLTLCSLLAALTALRRASPGWAGGWAALAAALEHRALLLAPFLLLAAEPGVPRRRLAKAAGATYILLVAPVAALDPGGFVAAALGARGAEGGIGVANLLLYRGIVPGPGLRLLLLLLVLAAAGCLVRASVRRAASRLVLGAAALLVGLLLAPGVGAESVAVPLVLAPLLALPGTAATPAAPIGGPGAPGCACGVSVG